MQKDRLITLSLVKYLRAELVASGWSNVTFVSKYPDDDNKVVLSGTGAADEIVVPVLTMIPEGSSILGYAGIGERTIKTYSIFSLYLYAASMGQELDLGSFISDVLYKGQVDMYPFTSGYPGSPEASIGPIYVDNVHHATSYIPYHPNVALRYGGIIGFTTLTYT